MLKKIFVLTLCAMMLLTAALAESDWTAPAPGDPMTVEGDICMYLNDQYFGVLLPMVSCEIVGYGSFDGMKDCALDALYGEPLDVIVTPACAFKGDDKEFVYDGFSVFTNPLDDHDLWYEVYITGGDLTTSRGIGIGATADEVFAAYGDNYYNDGDDALVYSISGDPDDYASPSITFYMSDDVVECIDIYYPTNVI